MTTTAEALKEAQRIRRMRLGQELPEVATIPTLPEHPVALVPLLEKESTLSMTMAAQLDAPDNIVGIQLRQRIAEQYDVWQALREPDDPGTKVFTKIDDMLATLEPEDITTLYDQLIVLQDYASPSIDKISNEDLDDLKKAFVLIDWSALTGRRWSALRHCLSILMPELLQVRSLSSTSTPSSTTRSENPEST